MTDTSRDPPAYSWMDRSTTTTTSEPQKQRATRDPAANPYADRVEEERRQREADDERRAAREARDEQRRDEREAHARELGELELERRRLELDALRRDEREREAERTRAVRAAFSAGADAQRQREAEQRDHAQLARVEQLEALAANVGRERRIHVAKYAVASLAVGAALGFVWRATRGAS